jgi:putative membrane protein
MRMMVEDHDKDVGAFQQESTDAADSILKAWVTKTLPKLQAHQRLAHAVQGKVQ